MLGVLAGQFLKLFITLQSFLDGSGLIARNVASHILSVLPSLQLKERPIRAFAQDRKLAALHGLDFCDLVKKLSWFRGVHGVSIYPPRYCVTAKWSAFANL